MEINCVKCGRISWVGAANAIVDGAAGREPFVEAGKYWKRGGQWRCSVCKHAVVRPSPKQDAIDDLVAASLRSQGA